MHIALARKYRPQNFLEVIGQDAIVKTLTHAIESNRLHHAYLFCGVRGVGKTSLARIMAKSINCAKGPTITPCQECAPCRGITAGNSLDVIEIDGASNNSVDNIRELRENVKFLPSESPYKIVIIDEVHMLSSSAFNALLKTLEEPPAHVKFIFATTEAHDIPITILSRCQKYDFRKLNTPVLTAHLAKIAESEKIRIDSNALQLVARCAQGSVRDALSLLDQIFSNGNGPVVEADVRQLLGLGDRMIVQDLLTAILATDLNAALKSLNEADERGLDLKLFAEDLLAQYRHLILMKSTGQAPSELSPAETDFFNAVQTKTDLSLLTAQYQILFQAIQDITRTEFQKMVLEITLVKLVQCQNMIGLAELVDSIQNRQTPKAPDAGQRPSNIGQKSSFQQPETIPNEARPATKEPSSTSDQRPVTSNHPQASDWYDLVKWITREKPPLGGLLREASPVFFSNQKIEITLPPTSRAFVIERLNNISELIDNHFGHKVAFSVCESPADEKKKL